MTLLRIGEILDWVPLIAVPFLVYFLTDGFIRNLSLETWLILGLVVLGNIFWLVLFRSQRRLVEFYEKYPGFRMKK